MFNEAGGDSGDGLITRAGMVLEDFLTLLIVLW